MYSLVSWSAGSPRARHAHRHTCPATRAYKLNFGDPGGTLARSSSMWVGVSLNMRTTVAVALLDVGDGEITSVDMEGGGWYSTWGNEGVGGLRARRSVRSMKGRMVGGRPRARLAHELMKLIPVYPSAT